MVAAVPSSRSSCPTIARVTTDRVLELVVFELTEGVSREQFLGTVDAVSEWARQQPGFLSRELSYAEESGRYVDVVYWDSMEHAVAADAASRSSEACSPMFALIELESALFAHARPLAVAAA